MYFSSAACQPIVSSVTSLRGYEGFILQCDHHINMEVNLALKKSVEEKMKIWDDERTKQGGNHHQRPINIIIQGIESVSRSHLYRSLPKTVAFLKKVGYIDFKGYHSLAPSTLPNFMAFLMGQTKLGVRESCAPDWESPFDNCSLVWKDFSAKNYITNYMEDGLQTFNWGNQGGFRESPTDYYLHPLFLALSHFKNSSPAVN